MAADDSTKGPETISFSESRRRGAAAALAFSDEALALRFAARHVGRLHYVNTLARWFEWDGIRHRVEDTLHAIDLSREGCREASAEAKAARKFSLAMSIESARTVAAVERLARADRRIAATHDQFDAHPELLNMPGQTIDLMTGKARPNHPDDFLTKCTAVAPGGRCDAWLGFLERIIPDAQTRRFLQLAAGYTLSGWTREHAIFFLYGTGANGKSVFLNTLAGVMGDYAITSPIEAFTVSANDRHPTELARLRGARLVSAIETEEGRRWDESRIKHVTGGDKIAARFMGRDFFEFGPEFKLWIAGNHKPALRGVDEGMRRRMNLIPFEVTIPEGERDDHLFDKLRSEWPGILQWAIDGALEWGGEGLARPEAVQRATDEYLGEEDAIGQWLAERCIVKSSYYTTGAELYRSWRSWADKAGEFIGSQKRFTRALQDRGFVSRRSHGGARGFDGIGLVMPELPAEGIDDER